ncbi:hypothetical protein DAT35_29835 [Vitiosangium sp. GDMCC 1.1324]|nr:hypothetical protein DAT35_29835 [Vitiosangium sp. GDMCC 1.1324]
MTPNGLTLNGLSLNGMSYNGLSTNGLSTNGLSTPAFSSWFNSNPASISDMVMRYLVRCAVPSGQSRTWTNPSTGSSYTWAGGLGLTPDWASGMPSTELEEQLITACLAAHVNKYGVSMQISIVGRNSKGTALPIAAGELETYSQKEAAFYGNLFRNEGVYVCKDPLLKLNSSQSTLRACSLESQIVGGSTECGPMLIWGTCGGSNSCKPDSSKQYYSTCSYNGKTYAVLSTSIRPQDIYKCGDGVCQQSESCGTGTTASSCLADCGTCE